MISCAFLGHLIELQKRLPHSLENEVLLCNVSWENAIIWFKDLDVSEGIYVVYIIFDLNSDICIPVHVYAPMHKKLLFTWKVIIVSFIYIFYRKFNTWEVQ